MLVFPQLVRLIGSITPYNKQKMAAASLERIDLFLTDFSGLVLHRLVTVVFFVL